MQQKDIIPLIIGLAILLGGYYIGKDSHAGCACKKAASSSSSPCPCAKR